MRNVARWRLVLRFAFNRHRSVKLFREFVVGKAPASARKRATDGTMRDFLSPPDIKVARIS
jgi:hypothetical protein